MNEDFRNYLQNLMGVLVWEVLKNTKLCVVKIMIWPYFRVIIIPLCLET